MSRKPKPRGEYRSWYTSIWDDDDFLELPKDAKGLLRYLKDTLPATGLGRVSVKTACDKIGLTRAEHDAAIAALEAPKPGRDCGWVMRAGALVWIVNGLRFEDSLVAANQNHRKFINGLLGELDADDPLVIAFRQTYPQWFDAPAKPRAARKSTPALDIAMGSDRDRIPIASPSDPDAIPIASPSDPDRDHTPVPVPIPGEKGELLSRSDPLRAGGQRARASSDAPPSATRSAPISARPLMLAQRQGRLPAERSAEENAFLSHFYAGASPPKRDDVDRRLVALCSDAGYAFTYEDVPRVARCASPAVRDALLRHVRTTLRLEKPHTAIVHVLLKAADGWTSEAEQAAARREAADEKRRRVEAERLAAERAVIEARELEAKRDRVIADTWAEAHPEEYARLEARVERELGFGGVAFEQLSPTQRLMREGALLAHCLKQARATPPPAAVAPLAHRATA